MKEIKDDLSKWRNIYGLEDSNRITMSVLSKVIYRFNAILIKISARFSIDIDQLVLKFIRKSTESEIAKTILKNRMNWG